MKESFQDDHQSYEIFTYEDCRYALSQYQKESGHNPFFVSGWDVGSDVLLPNLIVNQMIPSIEQNINKYYLVDDDNSCNEVSKYFRDRLEVYVPSRQIMIGGSATSLLCLVLLSLASNPDNQALVLEPSYFSVHDTFNLIRCSFQTICVSISHLTYDYDKIERILQERQIKIIVVTDPIFGSGISIEPDGYQRLVTMANHYHCTLVVDMARMGLLWNAKSEPILGERFSLICKAEQYAVVYSPCKKVFANGVKFGVLLSSEEIMRRLQIYSDSVLGSISVAQATFLELLLSDNSRSYITQQIKTNVSLVKRHYDILDARLYHSALSLIRPQMGHYALASYPAKGISEWDIFLRLLFKAGAYTLPMGLYGFHSDSFYFFRVNLLTELEDLISGMEGIIATLKNTE